MGYDFIQIFTVVIYSIVLRYIVVLRWEPNGTDLFNVVLYS